jgi:hypothetical protein
VAVNSGGRSTAGGPKAQQRTPAGVRREAGKHRNRVCRRGRGRGGDAPAPTAAQRHGIVQKEREVQNSESAWWPNWVVAMAGCQLQPVDLHSSRPA